MSCGFLSIMTDGFQKMHFNLVHVIFWVAAMCLLGACSKQVEETKEERQTVGGIPLPKNQKFLNLSSLQRINEVALGDLERASLNTDIDFRMILLRTLPKKHTPQTVAVEIFHDWRIGAEHNGRGILFLFVEDEGALKIEVGYELEYLFTDAFVSSFQDTLKNYYLGDFFGDVVSSMIITMMRRAQGESEEVVLSEFLGSMAKFEEIAGPAYLSGGAGVTETEFIRDRGKRIGQVQMLSDSERTLYAPNSNLEVVLQRYLDSLSRGINDPYLPLLTKGSQLMRIEYPKSSGFQRIAYRNFSGPYEVYFEGDFAAVRFDRPDVMPILFHRDSAGDWYADITKSWAYSQATNDLKQMNPAYGDHAWIFAWGSDFHQFEIPATPAPLTLQTDLLQHIAELESRIEAEPDNASSYFHLADVFYFECYWIRDAMNLIEKGLKIDPQNNLYRKRLIDFSYRFPDLSRVGEHHAEIFKHDPGDFRNLEYYRPFLRRHKPRRYKEIIEQTKEADRYRPLPAFPFYLEVESRKYMRKKFYLSQESSELRIDYQFGISHWHQRYTPRTMIYFSDTDTNEEFGIAFLQREERGELEVQGIGSASFESFFVSAKTAHNLTINWKNDGKMELSYDDVVFYQADSKVSKQRIFVEQRSGSSRISFSEN